jgi:hypothetical protein
VPDPESEPRLARLAVGAFVVGIILRLPGMATDFWFAEIWSLSFARSLESLSGVFRLITTTATI